MSREHAAAFIRKVGKSPQLQAEVNSYHGKGVLKRLVELGAKHGLHFTEREYRDAVVTLAEGDLSEESLNEVMRETGMR